MSTFVVALLVIALCAIHPFTKEGQAYVKTFLSEESTTVVNGIFVLLIFFSHCTQYIQLSNSLLDSLYRHFQNFHNQWVVTTFLAFSGYGVMLKILRGGDNYLKKYPRKRIIKTLVNYDIAVLIFLLVNTMLGIHYKPETILLSFIGLEGIGNSNWYIFTILLMFLISYITAKIVLRKQDVNISAQKKNMIATIVTMGAIIYVVIAQVIGLQSRFVSTVVTYALGMWIAIYMDVIFGIFKKRPFVTLIIILVPIAATYKLRNYVYFMNLSSCFFILLVVWFMTHFEINSRILYFFGRHAFAIYILQRLPMLIISHYSTPTGMMNYVFVGLCLIVTIGIAVPFDKILSIIDKKIIESK